MFDFAAVAHVGTSTEIHKVPFFVDGNGFIPNAIDDFEFIGLVVLGEKSARCLFVPLFANKRLVGFGQFLHFGFDLSEVFRG